MASIANTNPVYIYASDFKQNENYGVHPALVRENLDRLKEYNVDPSRIIPIPDSSYLQRELASLQREQSNTQHANLILGGGALSSLMADLTKTYGAIKEAVSNGRMNVYGQCAGALILCEKMEKKWNGRVIQYASENHIGLIGLTARLFPYPITKLACYGGDNRRMSDLKSSDGQSFKSIWIEGPSFIQGSTPVSQLAYYADTEEDEPPIAAASALYGKGLVLVSGVHSEAVSIDIPGVDKELIAEDQGRIEELGKHYDLLGITTI